MGKRLSKNQKLYLDEKEVTEVAEEYGTPLSVYSKGRILSNFKRLIQAFSAKTSLNLRIYYAMKANPNRGILRILRENGAYIDAEEQLELMREARDRWFKNKKILVSVIWNPAVGTGFSSKTITAGTTSDSGMPIKFGVASYFNLRNIPEEIII